MLKLKTQDSEDIGIISACLQDAVVNQRELHWDKEAKLFQLICQRYVWETPQSCERINARLTISNVENVQTRGLQKDASATLSLLAIKVEPSGLILHFSSHDAAVDVKLEGATCHCHIEDFGEPWPASCCPKHKTEHKPEHEKP